MRQVLETPFDPENPQKAVAKILGLIAEPTNEALQRQFELAAAALWIRRRAWEDPDWAYEPQVLSPAIALIQQNEAEKKFNSLIDTIYTRRLPAAEIASTLLAQDAFDSFDPRDLGRFTSQLTGIPLGKAKVKVSVALEDYDPKSQASITKQDRPSVNKLAEELACNLNNAPKGWDPHGARGWNRENIITRIWSPAKPILHLILALRPVIESLSSAGKLDPMALFNTKWVEHFVMRAEIYRRSIAASERLRISEADMISLRLVPQKRADV